MPDNDVQKVLSMVLVVLADKAIEVEVEKDAPPERFIKLEDAFNTIEEFKTELKGER